MTKKNKKNKAKKSKQKKKKEIVKPEKKKNLKGNKTQQKKSKKKKGRKNNLALDFSAKEKKRGKRQIESDDHSFSNKRKRRNNRRLRWDDGSGDDGIESDEDIYDSENDSIDFDEFDEIDEENDSEDVGEEMEKTQHEKTVDFILDVSNLVTGSIAAFLCSLGISLFTKFKTECSFLFMVPAAAYTIVFGFCMFLASLAGVLGRRTGHGLALCLHTFGRPIFVMLLLCFCLFGYLVATKGQGKQLEGMNIKEYKLEDYSKFLAWVARNGTGWDKAKKCLEKAEICAGLFAHEVKEFYNLKMTPLQSGCCKPPFACGYALSWGIFTNPTNDKADKDCDLWGHGFATRYLCFDCNSCRAGMAETIKARLLKMTSTNLGLSCGFVFTLLVECYLIRRERKKMEVEMEEAAHKELKEEEEEEWNAIMLQEKERLEDEYEDETSHSNYQQTQPGMQYNMYQPTIPYQAQSPYYQQGQYMYPYGY